VLLHHNLQRAEDFLDALDELGFSGVFFLNLFDDAIDIGAHKASSLLIMIVQDKYERKAAKYVLLAG
jgi:hypothetical protein